jgi:hypothetical protein
MFRGSNSGGAKFLTPAQIDPGAHPASYTMGTEYFPGVKRQGRGVDHPPHLDPRLKKEQSFTSSPPVGLAYRVNFSLIYLLDPTLFHSRSFSSKFPDQIPTTGCCFQLLERTALIMRLCV